MKRIERADCSSFSSSCWEMFSVCHGTRSVSMGALQEASVRPGKEASGKSPHTLMSGPDGNLRRLLRVYPPVTSTRRRFTVMLSYQIWFTDLTYSSSQFQLHILRVSVHFAVWCFGFSPGIIKSLDARRLNRPPDPCCCSNHVHETPDGHSWYIQRRLQTLYITLHNTLSVLVAGGLQLFLFTTCSHLKKRQVCFAASFPPWSVCVWLRSCSQLCVWCCPAHPHVGSCWRTLCNSWLWLKLGEVSSGLLHK